MGLPEIVVRLKLRPVGGQELQVERQPADTDAEIRIAIRPERPDLVPQDWTAERSVHLFDRLTRRGSTGRDAVLRVVAVPLEAGSFILRGAFDRVAAARRDDVHYDAGA